MTPAHGRSRFLLATAVDGSFSPPIETPAHGVPENTLSIIAEAAQDRRILHSTLCWPGGKHWKPGAPTAHLAPNADGGY
jgi:hypothetical protein